VLPFTKIPDGQSVPEYEHFVYDRETRTYIEGVCERGGQNPEAQERRTKRKLEIIA
jgi:hypothetical protein